MSNGVDSALLQRIRDIIATAVAEGRQPHFASLHEIDASKVRQHIEHLYYFGEIEAEARMSLSLGLRLSIKRLTPYGVLHRHSVSVNQAKAAR